MTRSRAEQMIGQLKELQVNAADVEAAAVVSVDGQEPVHLNSGDGVKILSHEKSLRMVRFEDPGYFYRNLTIHMEHNPLFGKRINGKSD